MLKKQIKKEKGITLVALIITIIILIILAAVSINAVYESQIIGYATNGVQNYVDAAKTENEVFENTISYVDSVLAELGNGNLGESSLEEEIELPRYISEVIGQVSVGQNTEVEDVYGNKIVIPEGFKIVDSTIDNTIIYDYDTENGTPTVQDGIVVQDEDGNQFVWVPVGSINNKEGDPKGETTTIELARYTFDITYTGRTNNWTISGTGEINQTVTDGEALTDGYVELFIENDLEGFEYLEEELTSVIYENAKAKDIDAFKRSAKNIGGYYIARYEASYGEDEEGNGKVLSQTSIGTPASGSAPATSYSVGQLWNLVLQSDASTKSQEMYDSRNFTSDLVNSYAWDTAIVFIQTYEDSDYSIKSSLNTSVGNTGERSGTTDKVCNIYDMASNAIEWTTETSTKNGVPCIVRGGLASSISSRFPTGGRLCESTNSFGDTYSFRAALYINQ